MSIDDELPDACAVGEADTRQAVHHGFRQGIGEAFPAGGQTEKMTAEVKALYILDGAGERIRSKPFLAKPFGFRSSSPAPPRSSAIAALHRRPKLIRTAWFF
jgi:hypothetical protein